MVIVGELINSTRKKVKEAMEKNDEEYIKNLAIKQDKAGSNFIDVNAGAFVFDEVKKLEWAMNIIQDVTKKPLSIDSPRPEALELGLKIHKNGKPLINSITKESERWKKVLPLTLEYDSYILGLCIDDNGIPDDADTRFKIAARIINDLVKEGKNIEDIAIDPITNPLSVNTTYGLVLLDTVKKIKKEFPEVKVIAGLSNISYGLPARKQINRAYMVMAMTYGLDGALIDPLDPVMISIIKAAESLLNKDPYCANYLKAYREGIVVKQ